MVSDTDLGVVTSERVYRDMIESSRAPTELSTYQPNEMELKDSHAPAWLLIVERLAAGPLPLEQIQALFGAA